MTDIMELSSITDEPVIIESKKENKVTKGRRGCTKKKRKRVGRACIFCQKSHMSCDEGRPCKRCIARGCADQCRDGKRKRRGRKRKDDSGEEEENELSDECKVDTILNDNSFNSSNESSLVSTEEEQVSSCISIPIPFCTNEYLTHLYDAENIRTAIYGSLEDYVFSHYPELIKSSFSTKCSSESLCDNSDVYRSFYSDGIDPELLL